MLVLYRRYSTSENSVLLFQYSHFIVLLLVRFYLASMHSTKYFYLLFILLIILVFSLPTQSQNVSINESGNAPNASAALDVDFSDRGFLLPRMTTAERDAISSPALSLQIFNTSTNCLQMYMGSSWVNIVCDCQLPGSFTASAASSVQHTQFDANWSSADASTTYFLDVATDVNFTSFVSGFNNKDVGNVTTSTVTGLSCGNTYYYRVRASNSCGETVNSSTITVEVNSCCASTTAPVDVTSGTGEIWMDRNLGASQVATSSTDALAYGDLYQWGRCTDGHEIRTSGTTSTLSSTDTPGHANFILDGNTSPFDWRVPQNTGLWQGGSGVNNPCPNGYRTPTNGELDAERLSWSSNNSAGAFASPLKLTLAGHRQRNNAAIVQLGVFVHYWSSTTTGTNSFDLNFTTSTATTVGNARAGGFSVRCIKDD